MKIQDSGNRRTFESGAVRDIDESKGRCDLIPLDCLAVCFSDDEVSSIFLILDSYVRTGNLALLIQAIKQFSDYESKHMSTIMLDVSLHYKLGLEKYGERNWEKGIPLHSYIDSAVRHLLKYVRGDDDEPHDRAFVWNLMCCYWTQIHIPSMWDLPFASISEGVENSEVTDSLLDRVVES